MTYQPDFPRIGQIGHGGRFGMADYLVLVGEFLEIVQNAQFASSHDAILEAGARRDRKAEAEALAKQAEANARAKKERAENTAIT